MKQQDYYNSKKEITLLHSIDIGTPEAALEKYNEWLKKQRDHKDDNILKLLHTSIRYGFTNIVKTILSSEEGCLTILSDESLVEEATNSKPFNLEIINALYTHKNTMTSLPFEDSAPKAPTIQGHIVDAFQDREGNLYPGDGSSSSTWKEVQAFQTITGQLIELTPDLIKQAPASKKRTADDLKDPTPSKQIKIEGIPRAVFQDKDGRFNIDADASRIEIIRAQDYIMSRLPIVISDNEEDQSTKTNYSSVEANFDPLVMLANAATTHDTDY